MKKYILYILTGVAACGLCSCEDALDRYPKDRLTPDNFFHTEEECQLYTNDFYTMFPSAGTIYGETADIIAKTTLTSEVLGNRTVPATAGSWKWEKLRDINFFPPPTVPTSTCGSSTRAWRASSGRGSTSRR